MPYHRRVLCLNIAADVVSLAASVCASGTNADDAALLVDAMSAYAREYVVPNYRALAADLEPVPQVWGAGC